MERLSAHIFQIHNVSTSQCIFLPFDACNFFIVPSLSFTAIIHCKILFQLNVSRPLVHNENGEEEEDADEPHPTDTDTSSYYIGRTTYNRTPHSRRLKSDEIMNGAISKLERLSSGKSDEFDGFGKSVASQLRRLPEDLAWEVQDKVTALLRESIRGTRKNAKGSELEATSSTAKGVQSSLTAPTAEVQSRRRSSSVSEHSINVGNQRSNQGKIISSHNPPQQNSQPVDLLDEHCENSANESFHQTEDDVLDDYWLSNEHPVTPPRDENENFDTMVIDVPSNSHIPVQPIENATSIVDEPLNSMNVDMPISSVIPLNSIENTMNSSKFKIPPLNSKKKVILRVKSKTEINKVCKPKVLRCNEDPLKKSSAISQLISKQPGFANILSKKKFVPLMGPANRTPVSVLQNINN